MRKLILFLLLIILYNMGCDKNTQQQNIVMIQEIQRLIENKRFESARIAAIDTLDPNIKTLYYKADDKLGHASHLDVRCNERIEEILYDLVKEIPAKNVKTNRDVYSKLVGLYPENDLYRKKFIYYDRRMRGKKQ
ncbi:MAG: hypothetical protein JSU72_16340 [Deltaproteobacteria bacterium]|nr:MAG: hypothetical protein JSU72_16340 [Deltaproteobacteria bacterium]